MSHVLDRIIVQKRLELAAARDAVPERELRRRLRDAPPPRDFAAALRAAHPMALIAEVKKASPSAGIIRADFDPVAIARCYVDHGAACLSVLTDEQFFQGRLEYLTQVRAAVGVPILRKDFLLDEYQLVEARAAGADCALLIAECLTNAELPRMYAAAADLGLQSLIEIYEPANLDRVLSLTPQPGFFGVNNRNLQDFVTDLSHCLSIRKRVPAGILLIGESGIHTRDHVLRLERDGVHAILVGESLMRAPDIGAKVDELLGQRQDASQRHA